MTHNAVFIYSLLIYIATALQSKNIDLSRSFDEIEQLMKALEECIDNDEIFQRVLRLTTGVILINFI